MYQVALVIMRRRVRRGDPQRAGARRFFDDVLDVAALRGLAVRLEDNSAQAQPAQLIETAKGSALPLPLTHRAITAPQPSTFMTKIVLFASTSSSSPARSPTNP